jgi:hypothetical protein
VVPGTAEIWADVVKQMQTAEDLLELPEARISWERIWAHLSILGEQYEKLHSIRG